MTLINILKSNESCHMFCQPVKSKDNCLDESLRIKSFGNSKCILIEDYIQNTELIRAENWNHSSRQSERL